MRAKREGGEQGGTAVARARGDAGGQGGGGEGGRGLLWMSEANVLSARKELKEPVNFHTVEKRHARAC